MAIDKLLNFQIVECLHKHDHLSVYRAKQAGKAETQILKVLNIANADVGEIAQLRNEYEILLHISDCDGVPTALNLLEDEQSLILVLSDIHGISVQQAMEQGALSVKQIVNVLSQVTKTLHVIHHKHIIHKDIKPSNLLWNEATEQIQLIDFGLAVLFEHSLPNTYQLDSMDGSLCYMPPEQTGRINRMVDYRSDYYALGMTGYELLCRERPYASSADIDEVLYAILAIEPLPPQTLQPELPISLSKIIMKLIAKDPEDRYQTHRGLLHDLSQYLDNEALPLAQLDIRSEFQAPNKVYGREAELTILRQALKQASQGHGQRIFIAGFSGIGKTSIAKELYCDIQQLNGQVISGKFDQLQRNQPLLALTQAFDDFFASVLVKSDSHVQHWQQALAQQLGDNIHVIARLIPNLEYLVQDYSEPLYQAGEEGFNRLIFAFLRLIKLLATEHKPLVIFIDDLQWADLTSVMLIDALFRSSEIKNVLFVGAYRDNEVSAGHPIFELKDKDVQSKWPCQTLALKNLTVPDIQQLICDGFQNRISSANALSQYLYKNTAGNPFFTIELLDKLIKDQQITLRSDGHWHYQVADLEQLTVADSVVALMLKKLEQLPQDERKLLQIAAAIGHEFSLSTLAAIGEMSEYKSKQLLLNSIHHGFIFACEQTFVFAHDGIQQAAYSLSKAQDSQTLHLKIGIHLLNHYQTNRKALTRNVFDICFHLNQCASLLTDKEIQAQLIELNLTAAQTARHSAAFEVSLDHAKTLVDLLTQWKGNEFTAHRFAIYKEAAESAYLCAQYQQADEYFELALSQASQRFEYCQVINLKVIQQVSVGQYTESFELGIAALRKYDIDLPAIDDNKAIAEAYQLKLQQFNHNWLKKGKTIAQLYDLPINDDKEVTLIMDLLGSLYASALMNVSSYQKLLTMELVNLSVKFGNTMISPIAYAWHGSTITAISDNFDEAYEFGRLAVRLNENKIHNPAIACKLYNMVANFIDVFKAPLKDSLPTLRNAYAIGMESGDKLYASYSIINELRSALSTGMPLTKWLALDDEIVPKLAQCDADVMIEVRESFRAYVLQLTGASDSICSLNNDCFNEQNYRDKYQQVPLFICLLDAWQIQSSFHLGQFEQALALSQTDSSAIDSFVLGVEKHFFSALTFIHFIEAKVETEKHKIWRDNIARSIVRISSLANSCAENYQHLLLILQGAQARLKQQYQQALRYFNQAIKAAKSNQFLPYQALANELAAQLCFTDDMAQSGQIHIEQAYKLYHAWGAEAKLQQLSEQYPDCQFTQSERYQYHSDYIDKSVIDHRIDLKSIMDTSLALSSQIELDQLISRIMKVVLESSGAQRAVLLIEHSDRWQVCAELTCAEDYIYHTPQSAVSYEQKVPNSVLQFVLHTGKTLHLGNAIQTKPYNDDSYVQQHSTKSMICLPLRHQGKTGAILYIENNLVRDFFTTEQFQRLTLLSSQMASAIDNSLNFASLTDRERHYRGLLKHLPIAVLIQEQHNVLDYANENAHKLLTISTDSSGHSVVEGRWLDENGQPFAAELAPIKRVFKNEQAVINTLVGYRSEQLQDIRWFILSAFPQYSYNN